MSRNHPPLAANVLWNHDPFSCLTPPTSPRVYYGIMHAESRPRSWNMTENIRARMPCPFNSSRFAPQCLVQYWYVLCDFAEYKSAVCPHPQHTQQECRVQGKTVNRLEDCTPPLCPQGVHKPPIIAFPVVEAKIKNTGRRRKPNLYGNAPREHPFYKRFNPPKAEQAPMSIPADDEQVTIAEEGCIPAIVTLLRSSEDVPTQYHALMTLCR